MHIFVKILILHRRRRTDVLWMGQFVPKWEETPDTVIREKNHFDNSRIEDVIDATERSMLLLRREISPFFYDMNKVSGGPNQ